MASAALSTNLHTFVIPAYRESPYLEECILHLKKQVVPSAIVIATSTPSWYAENLAKKYQLHYFVNPSPNQGIAGDWNFALSVVQTPWATIAHQDDIYEPLFTKYLLAAIEKNDDRDIQIAFTGYRDLVQNRVVSVSLNSIVKKLLLLPFAFSKVIASKRLKKLLLKFGDPICCPSVSYNLETLKGFKFSPAYTCVLDWEAWHRIAGMPGAFLFINKKLVKHRIHPESETTHQLSMGIRQREEMELFNKMWGPAGAKFTGWLYKLGYRSNKVPG